MVSHLMAVWIGLDHQYAAAEGSQRRNEVAAHAAARLARAAAAVGAALPSSECRVAAAAEPIRGFVVLLLAPAPEAEVDSGEGPAAVIEAAISVAVTECLAVQLVDGDVY